MLMIGGLRHHLYDDAVMIFEEWGGCQRQRGKEAIEKAAGVEDMFQGLQHWITQHTTPSGRLGQGNWYYLPVGSV